jgi:hypothetical protein
MVNIKKFPREYTDQVISNSYVIKDSSDKLERAPGPGLKLQAASHKHQAPSDKHPN